LTLLAQYAVEGVCPSVCPFVCPIDRQQQRWPGGGYAAERPTGRRYRLIAAAALQAPCCRRAGAQQEMRVALRREPTEEAQHRLVYNFKSRTAFKPPSVIMAVVG